MPIFYFDLVDCGGLTADLSGMELPDAAAARDMAIKGARDIMALEVRDGHLNLDCTYVIFDSRRTEIGRVHFRELVAVSGL